MTSYVWMPQSTLDRKAGEISKRWQEKYEHSQIAELAMAVLQKVDKATGAEPPTCLTTGRGVALSRRF